MDVSDLLYKAMSLKVSVTFMFCAVFSICESPYLYGSYIFFNNVHVSVIQSWRVVCLDTRFITISDIEKHC